MKQILLDFIWCKLELMAEHTMIFVLIVCRSHFLQTVTMSASFERHFPDFCNLSLEVNKVWKWIHHDKGNNKMWTLISRGYISQPCHEEKCILPADTEGSEMQRGECEGMTPEIKPSKWIIRWGNAPLSPSCAEGSSGCVKRFCVLLSFCKGFHAGLQVEPPFENANRA